MSVESPVPLTPSLPSPLDPREITSPEQIAAQLSLLARREADLTLALNALVSDRAAVDGALAHLRDLGAEVDELVGEVDGSRDGAGAGLGPALGVASKGLGMQGASADEEDAVGLVERVSRVWETSERVGGKVRRLDDEIGRVREATDVVTEVLELKNALQTLASSIEKSDWETAARACRRAMSVRPEVLEGGFAGQVVPTPQSPLPPPQQLEDLRNSLLDTFRTEFDAAAARKDQQEVSRYFRLWPGIGAEHEGLEAYGDFVVGLVKARTTSAGKPSSPLYYIANLTSLLESIAHIIDQHQPVVDKYYGAGKMRAVVGRLVGESDRVVRNLVEGWEEERRVGRLISATNQSRFALLANPALLPPLYASLVNHASTLSLASLANTSAAALPNPLSALQSYARPGQAATPAPPAAAEPDPGPDPRDVDRVLGELVALGGRWALFRRFVWGRLTDEDAKQGEDDMEIVEQSESQKAIENLLRTYYEPLELWFLRTSIEKAHRLDAPETSTRPHLSSILDDTFYLLKLVLARVLSAGSLPTLRGMREKVVRIVEDDYMGVLQRKMEAVYAGAMPGDRAEKERKERDQKSAFIIYLNDLDVSADYVDRLLDETRASLPQVWVDADLASVRDELDILGDLSGRFRSACRSGLEQLFNQLTRPRLRPLLDECYKDVSYVLDEDAFADAEEHDAVRKRFARAWDGVVDGYKDALTEHNYQTFFSMTVETLVRPWEKMVMGMRFTELGAIRYERDVRAVANLLSAQASYGGAREKFTRLQQIATVLNMDAEEDPEDFYSNSGIPWRLSKNEYNALVQQRQ
ncbi:Golgi transport complex subunit 4 [Cryptotrichosporon argae]